jgi:citrate synthase/citryl-CoA lyase
MGTVIGNLDDPRLCYDYQNRGHGTVEPDTKREPFRWVSEVAYKNIHRIVARGYDTTELVEAGYTLADVIFIDFQARIPLIEEEKMLNYVMIMSLEDGLSGPAAISRIVASSKTSLTQAAGASILAFGHAYGAYSAFGNMLDKYLIMAQEKGKTTEEIAKVLVKESLNNEALGVSSLMLKDPAAKHMFARAEKLGVAGKYIAFTKEIVKAAQNASAKPVDLDMLGATGATMMDLGFSPESTWAILAVARAFAAGAHYCEEVEREESARLGQTLTPKEDYDGPEDRKVPTLEERRDTVRPAQSHTPEEWKKAVEEKKKLKGSGWAIEEEIEDPRTKK